MEEFAESGIDPLTVSLYQMDLDRAQFLLRSYLRVRLLKVVRFSYLVSFLRVRMLFSRNLFTQLDLRCFPE